jgi:hypothetical protein
MAAADPIPAPLPTTSAATAVAATINRRGGVIYPNATQVRSARVRRSLASRPIWDTVNKRAPMTSDRSIGGDARRGGARGRLR